MGTASLLFLLSMTIGATAAQGAPHGTGAEPGARDADLVVTPTSFDVELEAGTNTTELLNLDNTGGTDDATFLITLEELTRVSLDDLQGIVRESRRGLPPPVAGGVLLDPPARQTPYSEPVTLHPDRNERTASVLIIGDGGTEVTLQNILLNEGYSVTIVADDWYYDGTNPAPDEYSAVVLVDGPTFGNEMPETGQTALVNYVADGGGLIVSEWITWETSMGRYQVLETILPVPYGGTASGTETYDVILAHPVTEGVGSGFTVTGGFGYNTAAVGQAVVSGTQCGDAVTVWDTGAGRIVQFANAGNWDGNDPYSVPEMELLFLNSVAWVEQGLSWLELSQTEGTVPAGTAIDLDAYFDATELYAGSYSAQMTVESNGLVDPLVIPTDLTVTGEPDIAADPAALDFPPTYIGESEFLDILISNEGTDLLSVSDITATVDDFSADPPVFDLPPGESQTVTVEFNPQTVGPYSGDLNISSNDPDEDPLIVPLTGEGVDPPVIGLDPDSFYESLDAGDDMVQPLTIDNYAGGSDLEYMLDVEFTGGRSGAGGVNPMAERNRRIHVERAKGEAEIRPGHSPTRDWGGPDMFGYWWIDSDEPGGPAYDWFDISGVGQDIGLFGDDNATEITLPFEFPFYENAYDYVIVSTNGFLTFNWDDPWATFGDPIPDPNTPNDLIAPFWTDLYLGYERQGAVYSYHDLENERFIIQYDDIPHLDWGGSHTFQAILYQDGRILFQYDYLEDVYATVGIENADGSDGLEVVFEAPYLHDGLAVLIGTQVSWLSVDPEEGVIAAGEDEAVDVTFDAAELVDGTYEADILVQSNDPANPELVVHAVLDVDGTPDVAASPEALDFGEVFVTYTEDIWLSIDNDGTADLSVSGLSIDLPEFDVDDDEAFVLGPGESEYRLVFFTPGALGEYNGTLTIHSDDPDTPALDVPLTGTGVDPPVVDVDPMSMSETLNSGESSSQPLTIGNYAGGSDLDFEIDVVPVASPQLPGADRSLIAIHMDPSQIPANHPRPKLPARDLPAPQNRDQGDILDDWNLSEYVYGMVWVEGELYVLYEGYMGIQLGRVDFETESIEYMFEFFDWAEGLTWDGEYFWIGFWGMVAGYDMDGNMVGSFGLPYWGYPKLAWDGQYLIVSGEADGPERDVNLARMDFEGTVVEEYYYENAISNMCWVPEHFDGPLWVFEPDDYLFKRLLLDAGTATVVEEFSAEYEWMEVSAIAHDGTDIWAVEYWGPLYQLDDGLMEIQMFWVDPEIGTVPGGSSTVVDVHFDAPAELEGFFYANLEITCNDPVDPQVTVPLELHIIGVPDIAVDQDSLEFGLQYAGGVTDLPLWVANEGTDILSVTDISATLPEYYADPAVFDLMPGEAQEVTVSFAPTTPGDYEDLLSILSNDPDEPEVQVVLTGSAQLAPEIEVYPGSLSEELASGQTSTQVLTVDNTAGENDLDYVVSVDYVSGPLAARDEGLPLRRQAPPFDGGKNEVDPRPGEPPTRGEGGPDLFGYSWIDSDEAGGPAYNWFEIAGIGVDLNVYGDDSYTQVALPFTFPFYGVDQTEMSVGSNGYLTFGTDPYDYTNDPIPSGTDPNDFIAPFWDDLHPRETGVLYGYHDTELNRYVVQWDDFQRYSGAGHYTFQAILHPNGKIVYQYQSMTQNLTSCTIGIENADASDGLQVVYNSEYVHDGLAVRISTAPTWLVVTPEAGILLPGETQDLEVLFDATDLIDGDYEAEIHVDSNDPDEPRVTVPASLHVEGFPLITVSAELLDFGTVYTGTTVELPLLVNNEGTDDLDVTEIAVLPTEFGADPTVFTVAPGGSQEVTVSFGPLAEGPFAGELVITSNDEETGPVTVALQGEGVDPPAMVVTPGFFEESLMGGYSSEQLLVIDNGAGGSVLDYTLDLQIQDARIRWAGEGARRDLRDGEWITLEQGAGSVPAGDADTVTVYFDAPLELVGDFFATLSVLGNDPFNPQEDLPVHLEIIGVPNIVIQPAELDFGLVFMGYDSTLPLNISNNGSVTLSVTDISAVLPDYDAVPNSLDLGPGEDQNILVTFTPQAIGDRSDALSISSNDPEDPLLEIPLSGAGDIAPEIALSPDSLFQELLSGQTATQSMTVDNSAGGSDLEFTVSTQAIDVLHAVWEDTPERKRVRDTSLDELAADLGKNDLDPRPGEPPSRASGGPDVFGHRWMDSNEPGGPAYQWFEISGVGTDLGISFDDTYADLVLPFVFSFYGEDKTSVRISSNGYLTFGTVGTDYSNDPIPSSSYPNDVIAPFWDDLHPRGTGHVYAYYDDERQRMIVQYSAMQRYSGTGMYTFQAQLYEDDRIYFLYHSMTGMLSSASIGIENQNGSDGLQVVYNSEYVQSGLAVLISSTATWLQVNPAYGVVGPGETLDLDVEFSAVGLLEFLGAASIDVHSNDPDEPTASIYARLEVTADSSLLPGAASNPFPPDGEVQVDPHPLLSWYPGENAGTYHVYFWADGDPVPGTPATITDDISYQAPVLDFGQEYHWRVDTHNVYGSTEGPVWTFTVRTQPDLVVSQVDVPAQVWTEQEYEVSWIVTNDGLGGTTAPTWYDRIYRSTEPVFDWGSVTSLGYVTNVSYLGPGESYSNSATFTWPQGLTGDFYIYVVADVFGSQTESDEGNNTTRCDDAIEILLTPPADLIVSDLSGPNNAFSGDQITLDWEVTNDGEGPTDVAFWYDAVYFAPDSVDNVLEATYMGRLAHSGVLDPDSSYAASMSVTIPIEAEGDNHFFLVTDYDLRVYEHAWDSNNTLIGAPINVIVSPPADLAVTTVDHPILAAPRQSLTVDWTVINQGFQATNASYWQDRVYYSTDELLDESDVNLGTLGRSGVLDPGSTYDRSLTVQLPDNIEGPAYLLVMTDHDDRVFEHIYEDNNVTAGPAITLQYPDLLPSLFSAADTAWSGQQTALEWTIENAGAGDATNEYWWDRVYLSDAPDFDPESADLLGSVQRTSDLGSGNTYTVNAAFELPEGLEGDYYLFVFTDEGDRIFELTAEDNNVSAAVALYIQLSPWPDLTPSVVDVLNAGALQAGGSLELLYTVDNAGAGDVAEGAWKDYVYLSTSPALDPQQATLLTAHVQDGPLAAGESYQGYHLLPLHAHLQGGTYYIHLQTDAEGQVYEHTDEDNNVESSAALTIDPYPPADLELSLVELPATGGSGQPADVSWTVTNIGEAATLQTSWWDVAYLSEDQALDLGSDFYIGQYSHTGALDPDSSYARTTQITLPDGISGDYYLIVRSDYFQQVDDVDRENNTTASTAIAIELTPPSDLDVADYQAPAEGNSGQPVEVHWTVENIGPGDTQSGEWYEAVYLSQNISLDQTDIRLANILHEGDLLSGESYSDSADVTLPIWVAGNYYLIFSTDNSDMVYEYDAEDNNTDVQLITITQPPPSDLIVSGIAPPAEASPGQPATVSWTLTNQGDNPAQGQLSDAVYFSLDETWDIDDPLLGISTRTIDIAPGAMEVFTSEIDVSRSMRENEDGEVDEDLPGLTPGDYHVIVRTDLRNNIFESEEDNNRTASVELVDVDMQSLTLGVPEPADLYHGGRMYYKVDVPAGETLRLSVAGDSPSASSELYAAFEYVPTRASFDYLSTTPYELEQTIIVPETEAGSYYIFLYGNNVPAEPAAVTLLAELVQFSITSITPDRGGDLGQVTLTVFGARFEEGAEVRILNEDRVDEAPLLESTFVDASEIQATFDMTGLPLGMYDVVVVNPDDSETRLEDGFTLEPGTGPSASFGYTRPGSIRRGGSGMYTIALANTSNNDLPFLCATIAIPADQQYEITTNDLLLNSQFLPDSLSEVTQITDHFDDQGWRVIPLVAKNVPVGGALDVQMRVWAVPGSEFPLKITVDGYSRDEFIANQLIYLELVRLAVLADESGMLDPEFVDLAEFPEEFIADMLQIYVDLGVLTADDIADVDAAWINDAVAQVALLDIDPQDFVDLRDLTTCQTVLNWVELGGRIAIIGIGIATGALLAPVTFGASAVLAVVAGFGLGWNIGSIIAGEPGLLARLFCDPTPVVASRDPNDIVGPVGYGDENWIAADRTLGYTIRFENDPEEATAPAQVVSITHDLDPDLDLTSFELGSFGFGDFVFDVPDDRAFYTTRLDVQDSLDLYVDLTAGLDVAENRAFWIFESIDPETGEIPLDPLSGFLAINDSLGHGEGFVTYTIHPRSDVETGDVVDAVAQIIFDDNEAIDTPEIFNTLDAVEPTSSVAELPAVQDTLAIELSWSGEDDPGGSGLSHYTIYAAIDAGPFEILHDELADTSTVVFGTFGHTYHFFSIAHDFAGNTEQMKTEAEASVHLASSALALALPESFEFEEDGSLPHDFTPYVENGDPETLMLDVEGNANVLVDIDGMDVIFSAVENWHGSEMLVFSIDDGLGRTTASDTTQVTVTPVNDAPHVAAALDTLSIAEDGSSCEIDLDEVFGDVDGDDLDYDVEGQEHLLVEIDGSVVCITPEADWFGEETLVFTADDGQTMLSIAAAPRKSGDRRIASGSGRSKTAVSGSRKLRFGGDEFVVEIDTPVAAEDGSRNTTSEDLLVIVESVNDAPEIELPESFTFEEDGSLLADFNVYVDDLDSYDLQLSAQGQANVTVDIAGLEVTFGAPADWHGSEEVIFTVDDLEGRAIASDTTQVTVTPVNDPPYVALTPDPITMEEDGQAAELDLNLVFDDVDGDELEFDVEGDLNLLVSIFEGLATITPPADWFGEETLTFSADDGHDLVLLSFAPQPRVPRKVSGRIMPDPGTIAVSTGDPTGNRQLRSVVTRTGFSRWDESTAEGRTASIGNSGDISSAGLDRVAGGSMIRGPERAGVLYDGRDTATVDVPVTVTAVNDAPVVVLELDSLEIEEGGFDAGIDLNTVFDDVDDATLEFSVEGDEHLQVEIDDGLVTITAPLGWSGVETLLFTADDGHGGLSSLLLPGGNRAPAKAVANKGGSSVDDDNQRLTASEDLVVLVTPLIPVEGEELPAVFSLRQNYPNPFNPRTMIEFTLPETAPAKLSLYDMRGRLATVLYNGLAARGLNTVLVDGSGMASGVYIYRLESEGETAVRKLLLVK